MKRHARPLAFEWLESKTAPSSVLVVFHGGSNGAPLPPADVNSLAPHALQAGYGRCEADQILRFIADHTTGGGQAARTAAAPTAQQCAAADEMMAASASDWNRVFFTDFSDSGTEL